MLRILLHHVKAHCIIPLCAGFFRVAALYVPVRKSEQGFCVKAVWKPASCFVPQPVWQSPPGARQAGQNIRTIADWSSSQYNNNNAWNQNFNNGNQNYTFKYGTYSVRAVRAF